MAKHGLNKNMRYEQIGLSFLRDQTVEREKGEEKREEEEEEEKKRRKRSQDQAKVWNYMGFKALNGFSMQLYSY